MVSSTAQYQQRMLGDYFSLCQLQLICVQRDEQHCIQTALEFDQVSLEAMTERECTFVHLVQLLDFRRPLLIELFAIYRDHDSMFSYPL